MINCILLIRFLPVLLCGLLTTVFVAAEPYVLNETRVIIAGKKDTVLITSMDMRADLDGVAKSVRDLVIEELMLEDGEALHLTATPDSIEEMVNGLAKANNTTQDKVYDYYAKTFNYTREQVDRELLRKQTLNRVMEQRIKLHPDLVIKESDVKNYWDEHPEKEEGYYTLQEAFVSSKLSKDEFEKAINTKKISEIMWGAPFTIQDSDLPDDKRFLVHKNEGDIVLVEPKKEGFEVTKLVTKKETRIVPFKTGNKEKDSERYTGIEITLKQQRLPEVYRKYTQELLDKAKSRIHCLFEKDRRTLFGE